MIRAWARLKEHWIRHLLAALQVAVGVAAVTAVMADVVPVVRSALVDSRENTFFSAIYGGRTNGGAHFSSAFFLDDLTLLQEEIDTLAAISVYEQTFTSLLRVEDDLFAIRGLTKVSPPFAQLADLDMVEGRFFSPDEAEDPEPAVAVISEDLAEVLFPAGQVIGETINIRPDAESRRAIGFGDPDTVLADDLPGLDVRVVGVFRFPPDMPEFGGFFSEGIRTDLLIPATDHPIASLSGARFTQSEASAVDAGLIRPVELTLQSYSRLYFRSHPEAAQETVAAVEALLGPRIAERQPDGDIGGGPPSSLLVEPAQSSTAMMRQSRLQGAMLVGAMGVAALIVSGFAVFTTFLASVAQRVPAVGLARSLGATRGRILREIVGEAMVLTSFGGVIGVLLSLPLRSTVLSSPSVGFGPVTSPFDVVIAALVGLVLAVAIGAAASLYPGWTVARLMPAEAFHEE